jgi:hypothetical protein
MMHTEFASLSDEEAHTYGAAMATCMVDRVFATLTPKDMAILAATVGLTTLSNDAFDIDTQPCLRTIFPKGSG